MNFLNLFQTLLPICLVQLMFCVNIGALVKENDSMIGGSGGILEEKLECARSVQCSECGVQFLQVDLLQDHIRLEHLDEWMPYSCGYCHKSRLSEYRIREHSIAHHPRLHAKVQISFLIPLLS